MVGEAKHALLMVLWLPGQASQITPFLLEAKVHLEVQPATTVCRVRIKKARYLVLLLIPRLCGGLNPPGLEKFCYNGLRPILPRAPPDTQIAL